jgi:hypothetical protein
MKRCAGVVAVLIVAGAANADSRATNDKQYFAEQEQYLAKEAAFANQSCGTNIIVKFDWTAVPADRAGYSPFGLCQAVLDGMKRVCEPDKAGKDAVKQQIKSITCGFGPQRAITLKDGAIDYKINFGSSNDTDFVFEYLQNNL